MQHSVRDGEGWFRNDTDAEFDLNTEFNDETIESGNLRDLYLYAKWVGATYTVTFNMNGATGAAPTPVSVQYPTKLSNGQIPRNVTRQYYSFRGWFLGQRPVGTELTVNTVIDGNKIFYAGWTASAEADAVRQNLQALYNEVNNTINTQSGQSIDRQYKDEYVIGSGVYSSSADPNLIIQINRVNGLLNKAALLLRGDTHYETVLVENGSGGVSEQLFEVTDYNYNEMKRVTDEINAFKQQNPAFDYGRIQPKIVNITQTGSVHSVTIATGGNYRIEAYGGSGGHIWSKNNKTALGGAGGHVKGVINLPAGTVLKVRVGGEGVGSASATINSGGSVNFSSNSNAKQNGPFNGGYNGGGKGGKSELKDYTGGSGGGGVSDVRRVATAYADG
jgi:hypothetical protein